MSSGWIDEANCKPYLDFKDELIKSCKTAVFKDAVAEIELAINDPDNVVVETNEQQKNAAVSDDDFDKLRDNDEIIDSSTSPVAAALTPPKRNSSVKKKTQSDKKIKLKGILQKSIDVAASSPPPNKRKRKLSPEPIQHKIVGNANYSSNHENSSPKRNYLLDRPVAQHIEATIADIDVTTITPTLKNKKIVPSNKKFGFLGLGIMGGGIVKNLLNSGHTVYVWNRTKSKCDIFVKAGAIAADTPSDVVDNADIIFSCVTDPSTAKDVSFFLFFFNNLLISIRVSHGT